MTAGKTYTKATSSHHNYKDCVECGESRRLADYHKAPGWRYKRAADPTRYKKKCKFCSRIPSATDVDPNFKPDRVRPPPRKGRSKAQVRADRAAYKRRARRESRIKAIEYVAEKGCCECGERDPRVLEFDHIEPSKKKHSITNLIGSGYSWASETLRAEIRKCRVICANCHRKHTIEQLDHYGHEDVQAALGRVLQRFGISE